VLIERSPRGSKLTSDGALVAGWAQAAVDAAAAMDAGLSALRRQRDSKLRIAASLTIAEYLLPTRLTGLGTAGQGAAIALSAVNSEHVAVHMLALSRVEALAVAQARHRARTGRFRGGRGPDGRLFAFHARGDHVERRRPLVVAVGLPATARSVRTNRVVQEIVAPQHLDRHTR
jgi:hypothetical protein